MPSIETFVGPPWFRSMCAGYLKSLNRRGRRPNTLRVYAHELRAFGRWLEAEAIGSADELTGGHIERFQDDRAAHVIAATQQSSASAVRGLLRWAASQEPPMCPPALSFRVTSPRKPTRLPRPIPRAELDAILAELAPVGGDLVRLRTRALFHTLLSSGARISEVLSLDRDQIRDRSAVVVQKGGSQKLILISETAELAIADYLEARSDGCPALFAFHGYGRHWLSVLAGTHKTLRPSRLTIKGVQWAWDGLSADLGVARWTSHMIRHTCATELLRQGVDSLIVARHLGHTGLQTIATYAEVGLSCRQSMLEVFDQRIRRAS